MPHALDLRNGRRQASPGGRFAMSARWGLWIVAGSPASPAAPAGSLSCNPPWRPDRHACTRRYREVAHGLAVETARARGLKRALRKVRKVAHPVRTAGWALSPKPARRARRAAFKVSHPGEALELAVSDQVVRSVRDGSAARAHLRSWLRKARPRRRLGPGRGSRDTRWLRAADCPRTSSPRMRPRAAKAGDRSSRGRQ